MLLIISVLCAILQKNPKNMIITTNSWLLRWMDILHSFIFPLFSDFGRNRWWWWCRQEPLHARLLRQGETLHVRHGETERQSVFFCFFLRYCCVRVLCSCFFSSKRPIRSAVSGEHTFLALKRCYVSGSRGLLQCHVSKGKIYLEMCTYLHTSIWSANLKISYFSGQSVSQSVRPSVKW